MERCGTARVSSQGRADEASETGLDGLWGEWAQAQRLHSQTLGWEIFAVSCKVKYTPTPSPSCPVPRCDLLCRSTLDQKHFD